MAPKRRRGKPRPEKIPGRTRGPDTKPRKRTIGPIKTITAEGKPQTAIVERTGPADPHLQSIYLNLLTVGMTFERAAEITQFSDSAWDKQARIDPDFGGRRARARERGPGLVSSLVSKAMMEKIAEGNPWWVRFAIINGYARGMIDPDAELAKAQADAPKRIVIMVSPEGAKYFKGNGDGGNGHAPRVIESDSVSRAMPGGDGEHDGNGTNGEHVSNEG